MWCSEWPRGIPGEWELGSGQKKSIQNNGAKMKSTAQDRTQASRRVWVYYTIGDGTQTQHHHKLHACCVATTGQLIVSCAPCATATPRRSMHHWLRAGAAVPLAPKPRPQNKRSDLALTQLGHWIGKGRYASLRGRNNSAEPRASADE